MKQYFNVKNNLERLMYIGWFIFFVSSTVFRQYQRVAVYAICVATVIYLLFSSQSEDNVYLSINKIPICTLWLLIFTLYVHASVLWRMASIGSNSDVQIMLRLNCAIIFCMEVFFSNKQRVINLLKIFVLAMAFYGTVCIMTTPIQYWGSDWKYGGVTTINRNTASYIFVISFAIVIYLYKMDKKTIHLLMIPYFILLNLSTGSRKGIIQMVLVVFVFICLINDLRLKIRMLAGIAVFIGIFAIVFMSVPYLQETYGTRMLAIFDDSIVDNSIMLRNIVRHNAYLAFLNSPIIGNGVDYSRYINSRDLGYYIYSHCNFIELLCNYGIIGFALYYLIYVRTIILSIKNRVSAIGGIGLSTIISLMIIEYGQVTYYIIAGTIPLYVLFVMASNGKRDEDCESCE